MSYYRFNRHELFSANDVEELLNIICAVKDISLDIEDDDDFNDLENKLYGLFDGYLYDDVLTTAASIMQVPLELCKRIEVLIDKAANDILVNGQRLTAV
jgi:hypothetical protein